MNSAKPPSAERLVRHPPRDKGPWEHRPSLYFLSFALGSTLSVGLPNSSQFVPGTRRQTPRCGKLIPTHGLGSRYENLGRRSLA